MSEQHTAISVIAKGLKSAREHGIPVADIAKPDSLGFGRSQNFHDIYKEGLRLSKIESVDMGNGYELRVFNTVAGSPHTTLGVEKDHFDEIWPTLFGKTTINGQEFDFGDLKPNNQDDMGFFDADINRGVNFVPDHFLTWAALVHKNGKGEEFFPVDAYDLSGVENSPSNAQQPAAGMGERKRLKTLVSHLNEDDFQKKLREVNILIEKRLKFSAYAALSIYNKHILPHLNETLATVGIALPEQTTEEVNIAMGIGYNRGPNVTEHGEGGGPQSHPFYHWHTLMALDLEGLTDTAQKGNIDANQLLDLLSRQPDRPLPSDKVVRGRLRLEPMDKYFDWRRVPLDELLRRYFTFLKQVDPLATLEAPLIKDWLMAMLQESFPDSRIKYFEHHSEEEHVHLRLAEGFKVDDGTTGPADILDRLSPLLSQSYAMRRAQYDSVTAYAQTQDDQVFLDWIERFRITEEPGLVTEIVKFMKRIRPTYSQLMTALGRSSAQQIDDERIAGLTDMEGNLENNIMAALDAQQIDPHRDENEPGDGRPLAFELGYNYPGVPGYGISIKWRANNSWSFRLSLLESLKGLAEQIQAVILNRVCA